MNDQGRFTHSNAAEFERTQNLTHDERYKELRLKMRSELTEYQIAQLDEYEMIMGPFALVTSATRSGQQILISLRNNRKMLARCKAVDRHLNMVLENVKEMWTDTPRNADGSAGHPVTRDRFISKLLLRGDSVIIVVVP